MKILGIGDLAVSNAPGEVLKTYALGSCVALILYDKKKKIAGMVHIALPTSRVNQQKGREKPGHFADTGVEVLFGEMRRLGSRPPFRDVEIKMAGGANVLHIKDTFKIGKRNVLEIKKQLWKLSLLPGPSDVGGNISRTVSIDVDTGVVTLSSPVKGKWNI